MNTAMRQPAGGLRTPLQQLFLLEERARLAGVHLPDEAARDQNSFYGVKCVINGLECIINMRHVVEAIDDRKVTAIPGAADWVDGVMNYRGSMVPVYRIHAFLKPGANTDEALASLDGPILVLKRGKQGARGSGEFSAIRVNRILGMQQFRDENLHALEQDGNDPDSLQYYVNDLVRSETGEWYLLEIASLLDVLNGTNPRRM